VDAALYYAEHFDNMKAVLDQLNEEDAASAFFLFLAGLSFTGAIINGPKFHPKLTLAVQL